MGGDIPQKSCWKRAGKRAETLRPLVDDPAAAVGSYWQNVVSNSSQEALGQFHLVFVTRR